MNSYQKQLELLRETSLLDRLQRCIEIIGDICKERRRPKMSVPVHYSDEDFYVVNTVKDAFDLIQRWEQDG